MVFLSSSMVLRRNLTLFPSKRTLQDPVYCAYEVICISQRNQLAYTGSHLLSCFIGKGKAQDICGVDSDLIDYVGIPVRKGLRLS